MQVDMTNCNNANRQVLISVKRNLLVTFMDTQTNCFHLATVLFALIKTGFVFGITLRLNSKGSLVFANNVTVGLYAVCLLQ
jgi:hypothetical protein